MFQILYEDDSLIVCIKDAGIATQTKKMGQKDMESLLKNYRAAKGEAPYIGIVHRLDQPVQGVMVFAKTKEAAAELSRQVQTKTADKFYYAVIEGTPETPEGLLSNYLLRDGKNNVSKVVSKETPGAKLAKLRYELIENKEENSVLRIQLDTGRHHQIRVQLAHAGMPIVGDQKYNQKAKEAGGRQKLALCSYRIGFRHPVTGKTMQFEIDNPFSLK